MNRDQLTLLSCSSSLALMLLTGNSVASEVPPQNLRVVEFKAPNVQDIQAVDVPVDQENPQSASVDLMSDTTGDLAINKYGCDCMGCRNQVSQILQSGSLALPQ